MIVKERAPMKARKAITEFFTIVRPDKVDVSERNESLELQVTWSLAEQAAR